MANISRRTALKAVGTGAAAVLASPAILRPAMGADSVRIGYVLPLSGGQASVGAPIKIGAEIARDQINKAGGIEGRPVELVFRDDKGNPAETVAGVRELVGDQVRFLSGLTVGPEALAIAGIMNTIDAIVLQTTPNLQISHELYHPRQFSAFANSFMRLKACAKLMVEKYPDVLTWGGSFPDLAQVTESWNQFSSELVAEYKSKLGKDVKIISPERTKYGTPDFKPAIEALMTSPVEGLFTDQYAADGITFFKQAKELGLFNRIRVFSDSGLEIDLPKALGRDMPPVDWALGVWSPFAFKDSALSREVQEIYRARTGDPYPHGYVAYGHVPVYAFAAAIRSAKSIDLDKVVDALETVEFDTLKGRARFRKEDHQVIDDIVFTKYGPANVAPFWTVSDFARVPGASVANPATPGQPFKM